MTEQTTNADEQRTDSPDQEIAFQQIEEDPTDDTQDTGDQVKGPKVYLDDGTPVRIRVMDEDGEFIPYQGSPEEGFYIFENSESSSTVVLD